MLRDRRTIHQPVTEFEAIQGLREPGTEFVITSNGKHFGTWVGKLAVHALTAILAETDFVTFRAYAKPWEGRRGFELVYGHIVTIDNGALVCADDDRIEPDSLIGIAF